MRYYIDKTVYAVYTELPKNPAEHRYVIKNPKQNKIYLDILERVDDVWIKLRFYENRTDEKTGETRLEIFEAYSAILPENHIKIEGLHDIGLYDGRFNINQTETIQKQKKIIYLVWNHEKTEGFFTTDKGLAYEARKGSDTNCFYEDGTPSKLAVAFCEIHGEKDCSSQMVEVEQK